MFQAYEEEVAKAEDKSDDAEDSEEDDADKDASVSDDKGKIVDICCSCLLSAPIVW